jgi:uncharacterized membrane protein YheB (UPF0754 family)
MTMSLPEFLHLLAFPLVGAAIGWTTNFLAIKMLFHPRKPLGPRGMQIQGLLPRRRRDLAEKIGATVADDILSSREISSLLGKIHWRQEVEGIVHALISGDLVPRAMQKLPGMELVLHQIQERLTERILKALDEHRDAIVSRFHDELDIREMVVEKIVGLDLDDLEGLVFRLVSRELRHIELVGGFLGLLVGAAQSLIFYFSRF